MRAVRVVSTADTATAELSALLRDAVDGTGPAVAPVGPGDPPPERAGDPVADDVAVVVATSGSTGAPKGVLLTGAALRASAAATHGRLGGPGRWLLALPAHHVAGVQVLLRSARAGTTAAVTDQHGGFRPDAFAAAAAGAGARYTSLVPTQLVRLLADPAGRDALRGFDAVLLGGAAADPVLRGAARDAGVRVVATYGMSETCGGCVYDGRPLDGVRVALGDDGRIHLGGATLAAGYRTPGGDVALPGDGTADDATADDGWFRTNDLGAWTADGRLEVLGRADDVIVTGGEKVAPDRVERALRDVDGVRDACVVGVPDPEWGERVVAAVVGDGLDPDAVRRAVAGLGRATPREIVVLAELPLRGIGKPDRAAVRALVGGQRGGIDRT